jgi:sugar transferase (PEP-CTERM/EpsH1 system associated)
MSGDRGQPPLVAHVIHRLAVGGLENGLVNLVNHMPAEHYRHAIVCLTEATAFRERIRRDGVEVIGLHKRAGQDPAVHVRLWRILRRLRPAIVHTRNVAGLEYLLAAMLARVPGRVHSEHGREMRELDGRHAVYNTLRRAMRPIVHRYVAVSTDLARWLVGTVGVRPDRVTHIANGVDVERFHPRDGPRAALGPPGFAPPDAVVVGTIARMTPIKDQVTLVRAVLRLIAADPRARERLRLVMVGDGPLLDDARSLLREARAEALAWLPGERADVPDIMRGLDLFVLPSLSEGVSNTILEAMASGLPVIATRVGGNPELVEAGATGVLVPAADPPTLAEAIATYVADPDLRARHGEAGRKVAQTRFGLAAMVAGYRAVYDAVLRRT